MDLRSPPPPGGLRLLESLSLHTGGNVCNTGMAMAKLGMKVAAAGLVGEDVLGRAIIERLREAGIDTSAIFATPRAQTSATVVAVEPGGERCFYHAPGVTALLDAGAFEQCVAVMKQCPIVQIGYFGLLPALTSRLPDLLDGFRAVAPMARIALDTVNPPGAWSELASILPRIDVFCPSRAEAAALSGETAPARMAAFFRRHMPRGLIGIKLDIEGCHLDDGAVAVTAPAYKVKAVDTTGAGDTWFGALLTALHHRMPLREAGRFANRAAADCCTALGASAGVQGYEQTLARL
jgi:sugar/nucleoside kinase (ribokinase family)